MLDVILDALIDSLIVFIVLLLFNFLFSFIEEKIARKLEKSKFSPLIGASIGLIPQCGFSIIGADLYLERKISIGTIIAIFIACSDEAFPILLASNKYLYAIILLVIKFSYAILVGSLIDLFIKRQKEKLIETKSEIKIHEGCCHHEIDKCEGFLKQHIIHPLLHSLKSFAYVLAINLIFSILIYFIGKDNIENFLKSSLYLSPLLTTLIGFIPNCASSVIISELFLLDSIPFGALLSGLTCNAGLGLIYLFKDKRRAKDNLKIIIILFISSLFIGYLTLFIMKMFGLA